MEGIKKRRAGGRGQGARSRGSKWVKCIVKCKFQIENCKSVVLVFKGNRVRAT
jgi:hypothetical protein